MSPKPSAYKNKHKVFVGISNDTFEEVYNSREEASKHYQYVVEATLVFRRKVYGS